MSKKISIPLEPLELKQRYKLLSSLVIPRPIAWISTQAKDGTTNLAPYSFFNVFGSNPPLIITSQGNRPEGGPKDTPVNIEETGVFVVNLLDMKLAEAMNTSAGAFPKESSEIEELQLRTEPSTQINVPMIADCPVNLECKLIEIRKYGGNRIVFGEVIEIHLNASIYDAEKNYILPDFRPIAKLGGNDYCTTDHRFQMKRPE